MSFKKGDLVWTDVYGGNCWEKGKVIHAAGSGVYLVSRSKWLDNKLVDEGHLAPRQRWYQR